MLQGALQKIQAELATDTKNKYLQIVGGFVQSHLRSNPEHASHILTEGKTVAGSLKAMETEARRHQSNGVGILTDEEGFAVVLQYFGIEIPRSNSESSDAPSFDVSVDDLL